MAEQHLLELDNISKYYGNIIALRDVSTYVNAGEVTCVLGDNGAGKSTFIKILAGVHQQTEGTIRMNGEEMLFDSPRDALDSGIATVYQDLAMVPLMSVWRNFFLGAEPTKGVGPVKWIDKPEARRIAKERDGQDGHRHPRHRAAGRHAVGRRASVGRDRSRRVLRRQGADPRRADLGARREAVRRGRCKRIVEARNQGLAVIFITHNPRHAYPVGNRFLILNRGQSMGSFAKEEISVDELTQLMAGGAELEALEHELEAAGTIRHEDLTTE